MTETKTVDSMGVEVVECVACGRVGIPEQIHRFACPHTGDTNE